MNQDVFNNGESCFKLAMESGNQVEYISNFTPAIYWLNYMHDELVKEGLITPFRELASSKKLMYWTAVCLVSKKSKWMRVVACFACYVYDHLNVKVIE